jgi:holo-[acyl-carrier protein] synthase
MIIGLGEDLVEISRIEKLIKNDEIRFLNKCFTQDEINKSSAHTSDSRKIAYFAKRFAAKEACLKALGTGMREGLSWHDMDIGNDTLGRPILNLSGGVLEKLNHLTPINHKPCAHITLSDEAGLAKATVILEAIENRPIDKIKTRI